MFTRDFVTVCQLACGDRILDQGEACDNGNHAGCRHCAVEQGYKCSNDVSPSDCKTTCGDGIKADVEVCDNGNQPGCSVECRVDKGYTCTGVDNNGKSVCNPVCGDKLRVNG